MILPAVLIALAFIYGILILTLNDAPEAKKIGINIVNQSLLLGATLSTLIYCTSLFVSPTL